MASTVARDSSPNPQTEAEEQASTQDSDRRFTSTTTIFREDPRSQCLYETYSRATFEIEQQRNELVGNSSLDFKDCASTTAQLDTLTSYAQSQFTHAEEALESQKQEFANIGRERTKNFGQYNRAVGGLGYNHWEIHRRKDREFFLDHSKQVIAARRFFTTCEQSELLNSQLDSQISSHIVACRLLRIEFLNGTGGHPEDNENEPFCKTADETKLALEGIDDMHPAFCSKESDLQRQLRVSHLKIGLFRRYLVKLKRLEKKCRSDLNL